MFEWRHMAPMVAREVEFRLTHPAQVIEFRAVPKMILPCNVRAADALAQAVNELVKRHVIDEHSEAAISLLDYASRRFGDNNPIGELEKLFEPTGVKGGDCTDTESV